MTPDVAQLVTLASPHARQVRLMQDLGEHAAAPGMYFIIDGGTERIIEEAMLYLYHRHGEDGRVREEGRVPSLATSRSTAYELAEWFRFLAKGGKRWRSVDQDTFLLYATFLANHPSELTGRLRDTRTIGHKFATVLGFYRFTNNLKLTSVAWDARVIGSKYRRGRAAKQGAKLREGQIRPFNTEELGRLSTALGPLPTERPEGSTRPCRDRLLVQTGLVTGMRGEEICHLRVKAIMALKVDPDQPAKLQVVRISKTKGKDGRLVSLRNALVLEMQEYIRAERKEAIAPWRRANGRDHGYVFVNDAQSSRPGSQLKTNSVHRRFNALMRALVFTTTRPCVKKGVRATAILATHSFHDLRHTFAITLYLRLRRIAQREDVFSEAVTEPWAAVAVALGHENWTTTKEVYLKAPGLFLDTIGERVHDHFPQEEPA